MGYGNITLLVQKGMLPAVLGVLPPDDPRYGVHILHPANDIYTI